MAKNPDEKKLVRSPFSNIIKVSSSCSIAYPKNNNHTHEGRIHIQYTFFIHLQSCISHKYSYKLPYSTYLGEIQVPLLSCTYNTRLRRRQIEKKEKVLLEAQHKKKLKNLKKYVTKFTSILKQALRSKFKKKTSIYPTVITQFALMPITSFNPQNLRIKGASPESQHVVCFPSTLLVCPIRMPSAIDLKMEES